MTDPKNTTPVCQIQCLPHMSQPSNTRDAIWRLSNRAKRFIKRRLNYLHNRLSRPGNRNDSQAACGEAPNIGELRSGDRVRVKTKKQILETLNSWNTLRGCAFMEEMWRFCGTNQRVLKRVERFLDERDYLVKKCNNIVILEGVQCSGSVDFGRCDRTCFLFWREEWLEKT
jgi:hypothetical protein